MYHVYVLQNPTGRLYVGQTDNLERRILQHNDPSSAAQAKYAPKHGPWDLVWSEPHADRASAMRRERTIKAMKSSRWIRENLLHAQSVEQVPARRD
jgi:putative endonuclease